MRKFFKRGLATVLALAMGMTTLPMLALGLEDTASALLTVDGTNLYANGYALILEAAEDGTAIYVDLDEDGVAEDGELAQNLTIGEDSDGSNGYDLSAVTIYGGSQDAVLDSTTEITLNGGEVYAIYAGGTAIFNMDIEDELAAMQDALEAALVEVGLLNDNFSDETEAALKEVLADLEATIAAFETDHNATGATLESMLESLETLVDAIETEVAPYIAEESESYLGEVGAALLTTVEDALLAYVDELEARLIEKAEDVLTATAIDALVILFSADEDMTEEDLDEYVSAIETLVNSGLIDIVTDYITTQSDLEDAEEALYAAEAAYTAASAAVTEYKATAADAPTTAQYDEPISYSDAYAAVLADLDGDDVTQAYTDSGYFVSALSASKLDNAAIVAFVQKNLSADNSSISWSDLSLGGLYEYTTYTSEYSLAYVSYLAENTAMPILLAQIAANIVSEVTDMNTVLDTNYDAAYAEWEAVEEAWAQYALDNEEYTAGLAPLEEAETAAEAVYDAANSAYNTASIAASDAKTALSNAITTYSSAVITVLDLLGAEIDWTEFATALLAGDISEYLSDIVVDISDSLSIVYFISDVATLLTGDMEDVDDITGIISGIYDLMEEYGLNDTFEAILEAALENLTDEFNEEYLLEELGELEDAMVGALETFADNLGTEGYPNDLETQLEEMLEEVIGMLEETGTDQEVIDAIEALLAELEETPAALAEIIADIYAEIAANMLLAELTADDIAQIIIDVLMENLETIMGLEVAIVDEAIITVNGGTVGTIYTNGTGEGLVVSGVVVTINDGNVSRIVDRAQDAAALLADYVAPEVVVTGGSVVVIAADATPTNASDDAVFRVSLATDADYIASDINDSYYTLEKAQSVDGVYYTWLAAGDYTLSVVDETVYTHAVLTVESDGSYYFTYYPVESEEDDDDDSSSSSSSSTVTVTTTEVVASTTDATSPATGDTTPAVVLAVMALLAFAGSTLFVVVKRK